MMVRFKKCLLIFIFLVGSADASSLNPEIKFSGKFDFNMGLAPARFTNNNHQHLLLNSTANLFLNIHQPLEDEKSLNFKAGINTTSSHPDLILALSIKSSPGQFEITNQHNAFAQLRAKPHHPKRIKFNGSKVLPFKMNYISNKYHDLQLGLSYNLPYLPVPIKDLSNYQMIDGFAIILKHQIDINNDCLLTSTAGGERSIKINKIAQKWLLQEINKRALDLKFEYKKLFGGLSYVHQKTIKLPKKESKVTNNYLGEVGYKFSLAKIHLMTQIKNSKISRTNIYGIMLERRLYENLEIYSALTSIHDKKANIRDMRPTILELIVGTKITF